jgi:hypothetical protein
MTERDEVNNYYDGLIEGIARFAHWQNGTQYVGTCGKTLNDAILVVQTERGKVLREIAFN